MPSLPGRPWARRPAVDSDSVRVAGCAARLPRRCRHADTAL